jgi:hypothetical protein
LKDGLASYELPPPTGPELAQIIREPARAAGLRFEEDANQRRLDDVLQEAAAADPASLPLLQFVLDALYELGRDRRLLTFAAYRALGGLEGAIARRADEVVDALSPEIQEALPAVLRALTTVRLGEEVIAARPALRHEVAGTPAKSALVDGLIAARLFVADEDAQGHAVVRIAHEALLSRWPRARDTLNADKSFLETRARLQTDARRWFLEHKNPDLLLPPGVRLAEGEEILRSRREEADEQVTAYIEASSLAQQSRAEKEREAERTRIGAEEAAKRERIEREAERRSLEAAAALRLARRTRYAALVAALLAIIAGAGASVGFRGERQAEESANRAEQSAAQAIAAGRAKMAEGQCPLASRDQALRSQSMSLALLSQRTAADGDTEVAILVALEALPKRIDSPDRPYLPEAEAALYNALYMHHQTMVFHHDGAVTDAEFDSSGDRIVTASFDGTSRIWDVAKGTQLSILRGHQGAVDGATFSPDGGRIITAGRDGTARVWDAGSGKELFLLRQPGEVHTALFSPDGTRILSASKASGLTLWDPSTGGQITKLTGYSAQPAAFSPDGESFVAAQGTVSGVRIWSSKDGGEIRTIKTAGIFIDEVTYSPDGARLWQPRGTTQPTSGTVERRGDCSPPGHKMTAAAFSHDGRVAATAFDGAARLWIRTAQARLCSAKRLPV